MKEENMGRNLFRKCTCITVGSGNQFQVYLNTIRIFSMYMYGDLGEHWTVPLTFFIMHYWFFSFNKFSIPTVCKRYTGFLHSLGLSCMEIKVKSPSNWTWLLVASWTHIIFLTEIWKWFDTGFFQDMFWLSNITSCSTIS